jgi:hypothetical protein
MPRTPTSKSNVARPEKVSNARDTPYALNKLFLDKDNPRFGMQEKASATQADILDHIVEKFGVDDVLSSVAVNGYFEAEPMVCRGQKKFGYRNSC